MPQTYVVTGAAGFIGSHIAEGLLRDGQRVRVIDNLLTGKPRAPRFCCNPLTAICRSPSAASSISICLQSLFRGGPIFVLHQAALPSVPRSVADPLETHRHCVTGTLNVLIAARDNGVKRGGLRGFVRGLWRSTGGCESRDHETGANIALRRRQASRRILRRGIHPQLRIGDGLAALLQRFWSATGSELALRGGNSQIHHHDAARAKGR